MQFVRGNVAIRDHLVNGKELHLSKMTTKGHAQYLGQMRYDGYELVPNIPDRNSNPRTIIIFHLIPSE